MRGALVFRKDFMSFATFASVLMGIGRLAKVDMGCSSPNPLRSADCNIDGRDTTLRTEET